MLQAHRVHSSLRLEDWSLACGTLVPVTESRFETKIRGPKDASAQAVGCLPSMLWAGCLCGEVFRGWQTSFYLLPLSMTSAIFASQASTPMSLAVEQQSRKSSGLPALVYPDLYLFPITTNRKGNATSLTSRSPAPQCQVPHFQLFEEGEIQAQNL